jgi:TetR/AcrR family tetracycline transcriptional repressor
VTNGLDRDTIVTAALKLLNEVGLDGLTLRRLAQALGVRAPALYWHVRDKRELLDLMAARITLDCRPITDPGPGETWQDTVVANGCAQRHSLLAYRDGARLVAGASPLEASLPHLQEALAPLVRAGFTPAQAIRGVMTISLFVGAFVVEEQAEKARRAEQELTDADPAECPPLVSRPGLDTVLRAFAESGDPSGDDAFHEGLQLIVDGLTQQLARPSPRRDIQGPDIYGKDI